MVPRVRESSEVVKIYPGHCTFPRPQVPQPRHHGAEATAMPSINATSTSFGSRDVDMASPWVIRASQAQPGICFEMFCSIFMER